MLKHIVMFKLRNSYQGKSKEEISKEIKEALEKLPSIIPQIIYYEVGINELKDPRACDLVIISEFKDQEDLQTYKNHPAHKETLSLILERAEDAKVVDYFV